MKTLTSSYDRVRTAEWVDNCGRSLLREMVTVVSRPGILSLAGGLPATELLPAAAYGDAVRRVLEEDPRALQYGPPVPALKEHIVGLMARRGVECSVDEVFITSGAQQGLDIVSRVLLDRRSLVAMEELTFIGIHQVTTLLSAKALTVPSELESGLDVDRLEAELRAGARPVFLYTIPDAHNPLGTSLAEAKRERLVELAACYGMLIVEDDPYGLLSYDGDFAPPCRARNEDWTVYLGSFSKILAPGLRLGWLVAPRWLVEKVSLAKEASDLESSSLTQRAVVRWLEDNDFDAHLDGLRHAYRERRDAMLDALGTHFPASARFTRPQGGMFVWVELEEDRDCSELLRRALDEGLAFIPGHAFTGIDAEAARDGAAAAGERPLGRNCMRLSFSSCEPERIREGVERLGALLAREET